MAHIIKNAFRQLESIKNYQKEILRNKGVSVIDGKNQLYYTESIKQLPDLPIEEKEEEYQPDPYFVKMEQDYLNDPLLKMNGGIYTDCHYIVLKNLYDTTYLAFTISNNSGVKPYVITSDGQVFDSLTTNNLTITWDKTKDLDRLVDGTVVRWIKIYRQHDLAGFSCPCYPDSSSNYPDSPVVFYLFDITRDYAVSSSGKSHTTLRETNYLRYIIAGKSVNKIAKTLVYDCLMLECIKSYNPLTLGEFVGGGCISLKYIPKIAAIVPNAPFYSGAFKRLDLRGADINSSASILTIYSGDEWMLQVKDVLLNDEYKQFASITAPNVETLVIPKSEFGNKVSIICRKLKHIFIPTDYNNSLYLTASFIPKEEMIMLFNNLKDLTNEESKTLQIMKNYKYILTEQELAIAQNKNWTISFINV